MRTAVVVLVLALLAGCTSPTKPTPADDVQLRAAPGCDLAVFPGIRGREPDVAVDPAAANRVAAAAMVSIPSLRGLEPSPASLAIWTAVARSSDGGASWTWRDLPGWPGDDGLSPFTGSVLVGDPILTFLDDGTLLLVGLQLRPESNLDLFAVRFTGDSLDPTGYVTIARGAYGDPALAQVPGSYQLFYNDKPEVAYDPATGDVYLGWMWRTNGAQGSRAVPVVSLSQDGGQTWAPPAMLLGGLGAGALATTFGPAVPFVSGDRVHALWWDQVAGELWQADAPAGTLDFGAGRLVRATTTAFGGGKGVLASGLVQAAVHGAEVAVTWSQEGDAFDAVVLRSHDAGMTWDEPFPVTPTPGDQLLPTVAFGRDGSLAVHLLDNSEAPASSRFRARLWVEHDSTVLLHDLANASFDAQHGGDAGQSVGDYHGLAATADGFVAVWQDGRDGTDESPFSEIRACRVVMPGDPASLPR